MSERSISPFERYGQARPVEDAALQIHVFIVTDTLSNLSQQYLGDWRLWRVIAERNNIIDPRQIEAGTQLIIPRIPKAKGNYESL